MFPAAAFSMTLGQGPYATYVRGSAGANPFGNVWWIDGTNGSDGNGGTNKGDAFATVAAAIAVSAAGDSFIINGGTYTFTAACVPKANQTFIAAVVTPKKPKVIFLSSAIADLVQVDVSGVAFIGIEFQAGDNTCDNLMDIADGAAVAGLTVQQCVFNGADKTSVVGMNLADATFAASQLNVQDCLFRDLTGTMINVGVLGMAYSLFRHNYFALDVNSGTVFALADTTTFAIGKGWHIDENYFLGFDATKDEVGITIAGTEDTTGAGLITRNVAGYFAVAWITIDKLGFGTIQNFTGDATGGLLEDVGS